MKSSSISKEAIEPGEEVKGSDIRQGFFDFIQSAVPNFGKGDYISLTELNQYRRLYLTSLKTS